MSHIVVHRIEDLARRRLAVAWQRAALPPQPIRAELTLWQLNRVGFAHARTPKMMSRSVGQGTPAQQLLRDDPNVLINIQNQFPDLDLSALIVSPELPGEVADAVQTNVAYYDPNALDADTAALYKPSGVTRLLSCIGSDQTPTLSPDHDTIAGESATAPLIVRGISWSVPFIPTGAREMLIEVLGIGALYSTRIFDASNNSIGGTGAMAQWILSGVVQPVVTFYWDTTQGGIPWSAGAWVTVEPLIQIG